MTTDALDAVLAGASISEIAVVLLEGAVIDASKRFASPARRLQRALDQEAVRRDFEHVPTFDRWISTAYKNPEFENRGGWDQLKQWKADYQRDHGDLMRYHVGGETGLIGRRHVPALRRLQRTYGLQVAVRPATSTVILTPRKHVGESVVEGMGMSMQPPPRPVGATVGRDSEEDQKHKAWIEPNGRTHAVTRDQGTHLYWINDNHDKLPPEMHKGAWYTETKGDDFKTLDSEKVANRMIKAGWIRKAAKDAYHVWDRSQVPQVMKHVRRWHPEVQRVDIDFGPNANRTTNIPTDSELL